MRTLLQLGMFVLSNLGYWEYFREKHKINLYFAPMFTLAAQFSALFVAGICNGLEQMTFVLYALGLLLCLKFLYQTKLRGIVRYFDWGYLYFAAVMAIAAATVFGCRFAHIDNFTHWATVVRSMLFTDRFPCFKDPVVTFSTYPLGTAAYIYYFCRLTNDAEWFQMLAQGYMIVCTILPVFAYARKNKFLSMLLLSAMTLFLLQYNVRLTDLQVDTVMPVAGVAAMVFAYEHCVSAGREETHCVYYAFLVLLWVMNIKHAAMLYVLIVLIILLVDGKTSGRQWKECLILSGALLLARQVWSMHSDYVFYEENVGMHSMSADWFRYVLGEKTPEDVWRIVNSFVNYVTAERNYFWLLSWLALLAVLVVWTGGTEKKKYAGLLGSAAGLYAVYTVGVLGMYVFSMPVWEGLNGAERYMKSADVSVFYIFALCAVRLLSGMESRKWTAVAAAAVIAMTLVSWNLQTGQISETNLYCDEEERQLVEQPIVEHGFGLGNSYLLCISEDMKRSLSDLIRYIWRYNLLTASVDQIVVTEESQLDVEKNYDYVVIFDRDNPVIQQWMQEHYPDRLEQMVIQHFT